MTQEPQEPLEEQPNRWVRWLPAIFLLVVAVVLIFTQVLGDDEADEEPPTTSVPATTVTTTPEPTDPADTPPDETTPTSEPAETTTLPTETTATTDTAPPSSDLPSRAIATSEHLQWVDPSSGATETIGELIFEAAWATDLALSPDSSVVYYHRGFEDSWFDCESTQGQVVRHDLTNGSATVISPGRPALSPNGQQLAYLTAQECYPDPQQPDFFLSWYDTLVIADPDGETRSTFPLGDEATAALLNLLWLDDTTLIVSAENGTHYQVPVDANEPTPISDHPTLDLPDAHLYTVVGGVALAVDDPEGELFFIDIDSGDTRQLGVQARAPHAVGVSRDGRVIASVMQDEPVLLVDVDLVTGEVGSVVPAPHFAGIDW